MEQDEPLDRLDQISHLAALLLWASTRRRPTSSLTLLPLQSRRRHPSLPVRQHQSGHGREGDPVP